MGIKMVENTILKIKEENLQSLSESLHETENKDTSEDTSPKINHNQKEDLDTSSGSSISSSAKKSAAKNLNLSSLQEQQRTLVELSSNTSPTPDGSKDFTPVTTRAPEKAKPTTLTDAKQRFLEVIYYFCLKTNLQM